MLLLRYNEISDLISSLHHFGIITESARRFKEDAAQARKSSYKGKRVNNGVGVMYKQIVKQIKYSVYGAQNKGIRFMHAYIQINLGVPV